MNLRRWAASHHWLLIPVVLFLLGQTFSFALLASEKDRQEAIPAGDGRQYFVQHHEADPAWEQYVAGWNGQAYREIATNGYPAVPPKTEDGQHLPSPWSFYPLYPLTVKAVMALTGAEFGYAAMGVSLTFGLATVLLLYQLVYGFSKRRSVATLSVVALLAYPAAPLMQLAYNESLALFLLILSFTLIHKQRYVWAMIPLVLLGLTRAVGPPDFALLALHGLYLAKPYWPPRNWTAGVRTFLKDRKAQSFAALTLVSGLGAGLWPLLSWVFTGESAFINSRIGYAGGEEGILFGWLRASVVSSDAYPLTPLAVVLVYLMLSLMQLVNKNLPHILRLWPLILCAYIFTVTGPAGNEERYLMLGFFTLPLTVWPERRLHKAGLGLALLAGLALMLYLQWSWVHYHWVSETGALRKNV